MISDSDLLRQHKEHKKISKGGLSRQYSNTRKCQAFYAGDTADLTGKVTYRDSEGGVKYALCQFNYVKPYVNGARGFLLQTRNKVSFAARSQKPVQQFHSDYANQYHDYNRDNARAKQIESRQSLDMLVNGYGVTDTYLTFGVGYASRNPDGEIGMMRFDPNKYWWDPSARETNIIDRKWDGYTKEYYLDEAKDLFDAEPDDFEKQVMGEDDAKGDYHYNSQGGVKNLIRDYYDFSDYDDKIINVDFYQWCEIQTYYRAYNPIYEQSEPEAVLNLKAFMDSVKAETRDEDFDPKAEILNCSKETKAKLEEVLEIEFTAHKRNCYYSAVISGKKIFTKYKNISQDGFTRKVKTGDFDEKNKIWVGMVNAMMEPQKYFNKAITEFLYTIAALAKGGVMYEEDAIEDIAEFEANYIKADANAEVAPGALSGNKIRPKREGYAPTGVENIIELSSTSFPKVTGLPDGFLGAMESGDETAALQRQRIKQATNTLASYVDAELLYSTEHARLMLDLMRELASFGGERYFRMYDEEDEAELVPVKLDHFVNEYDIDIQEAPETELEKAERSGLLERMGTNLLTVGDPSGKQLYALAIEDMPLDARKKAKALQALQPEEVDPMQHAMLQKRVQELESLIQSGEMQKTQSETELNKAKTVETMAKAKKPPAEIIKLLEESKKAAKETDLATPENVSL